MRKLTEEELKKVAAGADIRGREEEKPINRILFCPLCEKEHLFLVYSGKWAKSQECVANYYLGD